jgi:hypothetical protein
MNGELWLIYVTLKIITRLPNIVYKGKKQNKIGGGR